MKTPTLNSWQRANMRAFALSFRKAYPLPSVLAHAVIHRELSFVNRPLWERHARAESMSRAALACLNA